MKNFIRAIIAVLILASFALAADQRVQYGEKMRGANAPAGAEDTLNRLTMIEHNSDGTHSLIGQNVKVLSSGSLSASVASYPTRTVTFLITGTVTVSSALVVPANISIWVEQGGMIVKSSGSLTINGPLSAGLYQVFSGFSAGDMTFGTGSTSQIELTWFGLTTSSADNVVAIQSALDSSIPAQIPVHAPSGTFKTSTFYVPPGIIFFGNGASTSLGYSPTTFKQVGSTDTMRFKTLNSFYWLGVIRDMGFLGNYASGTAGHGISFQDSVDAGVEPQDTSILSNIIVMGYPSDGIYMPKGALPVTLSNLNLWGNKGHGIKIIGNAIGHQILHFKDVSGDGNTGGDGTGGALIYLKDFGSNGQVVFSNVKSEKASISWINSAGTGNQQVIIADNCDGTPILINGLHNISSVPDGLNYEKPGSAVRILSHAGAPRPYIQWNALAMRVRAGDTGPDPAAVQDDNTSFRIPYTITSGIYGRSYTTGTFGVDNDPLFYQALTTLDKYTARSVEGPGFQVAGPTPAYTLYETDAAADQKLWAIIASGGNLTLRTAKDDGTSNAAFLTATRVGNSVTNITVPKITSTGIISTAGISSSAGLDSTGANGSGYDISTESTAPIWQAQSTNNSSGLRINLTGTATIGFRFQYNGATIFTLQPGGAIQGLVTTNGPAGTLTLASGAATTTVNNTAVTASSLIYLMPTSANAAADQGSATGVWISAKVAGTSFTITHPNNANADKTFNYLILN